MTNPIQRLQQMMFQVEAVKNDRRRLDQQDRALAQQDDAQRLSTAVQGVNMLTALLSQAQQLGDEAQTILPQVIAQGRTSAGTPFLNYDALSELLAKTPQSTAYYAGESARRANEREEVNQGRILDALEMIPDENIRDAAINSFSQSLTGTAAGTSRQQRALSDRDKIDEEQMDAATEMMLGLVLTPQQTEAFKNDRARIAQAWKSLGLQESFGEFDRALGLAEFRWRQDQATNRGGPGGPGGLASPVELTKQMVDLLTELEKPGQTDGARAVLQTGVHQLLNQMTTTAAAWGDTETVNRLRAISPADVANMGPRTLFRAWGQSLGGAKPGPMPPQAQPPGPLPGNQGMMSINPFAGPQAPAPPMIPQTQVPQSQIPPEVLRQLPENIQRMLMTGTTIMGGGTP